MRIEKWLAAASIGLTSLASQADVIYEWKATNNEVPRDFGLRIVLADRVVQNGSFNFKVSQFEPYYGDPKSGLISLSYFGSTYKPREEGAAYKDIDMSLQFGHWSIASGYIRLLDENFSFAVHGSDGWTITRAASDGQLWGHGCAQYPGYGLPSHDECHGARGEIRQIPEPTPLSMIALGTLGAIVARRWKTRQTVR